MFFKRPAPPPNSCVLMSFRLLGVDAGPFQTRDRCRVWLCVCVQFGAVEARAYISGNASWRVDLCGMGAGLHRNHVPGLLGVKRSPTGTSAQMGRAFRDSQPSCDVELAGRATLPQQQTFINFFSK